MTIDPVCKVQVNSEPVILRVENTGKRALFSRSLRVQSFQSHNPPSD